MRCRYSQRLRLLPICVIAALCVPALYVHWQQSRPVGRLTAAQALQMSRPILLEVIGGDQPLFLSAQSSTSTHLKLWSVLCSDAQDNPIARMTWNAETGELFNLCIARPQDAPQGVPLNSREAVRSTYEYLTRLGLPDVSHCHTLRPPHHASGNWSVQWAGERWHALVEIRSDSGELCYFQIMPNPKSGGR